MFKLKEWFLLFLATMASSHAEDRRLAKDGGEVRTQIVYALLRAMGVSSKMGWCPNSALLAVPPGREIYEVLRVLLGFGNPAYHALPCLPVNDSCDRDS